MLGIKLDIEQNWRTISAEGKNVYPRLVTFFPEMLRGAAIRSHDEACLVSTFFQPHLTFWQEQRKKRGRNWLLAIVFTHWKHINVSGAFIGYDKSLSCVSKLV